MSVRSERDRLGWSQRELAERAGLSRTEVSAIETARVTPSAAIAIRLARALGSSVETLFGEHPGEPEWAWPTPDGNQRHWLAEIGGRVLRVPSESSSLGLCGHDRAGAALARDTLVIAGCDPAIGVLARPLAERGVRLVSVTRSSRDALALMNAGRVHLAGAHLSKLAPIRGLRQLRMAVWESGLALARGTEVRRRSVRSLLRLRWAARAPGSGAHECMSQLLEGASPERQNLALDHREVAASIRSGWAEAGICIRLTAAEAGLEFSPVRREAYELCHPEAFDGDRRLAALFEVLRSRDFRATLGDLPGYDSRSTGELRIAA